MDPSTGAPGKHAVPVARGVGHDDLDEVDDLADRDDAHDHERSGRPGVPAARTDPVVRPEALPDVVAAGLIHDYGRGPVLELDELVVAPGIHHLQGANGAGKTTLLRVLATLVTPTAGRVRIAGLDPRRNGPRVRALVGYAGHEPSLHGELTVEANLTLHARLHGVTPRRVKETLDTWQLTHHARRRVRELSHGYQRRTDLARALLHRPRVLLLDEPTSGLDEASAALVTQRLLDEPPRTGIVAAHGPPPVPVASTLELHDGRLGGDAS